jgi:AcrR family transcriptional regulator
MAYYSEEHLERLQLIMRLRQENNSIEQIKEILHPDKAENQDNQTGKATLRRREDIITSAIHLFREKGFNDTSITDIVQHARAGRGTFYAYFTNKEQLFFECADQVFKEIDKDMQDIQNEPDILHKIFLRWTYFTSIYPKVSDMINLIRGASVSGHEAFTKKLDQIMHNLIEPLAEDLMKGTGKGLFCNSDPDLIAWMLMGAAEYGSYFLHQTDRTKSDRLHAEGIDIIFNGWKKDSL